MEKRTLNIKAPVNDKTGLGRAAKNIFDMMKNNLSNEYKITIEPITLENKAIRRSSKIKIRSGASRFMLHRKKNKTSFKKGKHDINFIFCAPYMFETYIEKDSINIGYTMWETDSIHESFVSGISKLDALIVPCTCNKKIFSELVDTYVIPVPEESDLTDILFNKMDRFSFYSIYDWTARKGGPESIEAFFSEFDREDNVELLIKTKGPLVGEVDSYIKKIKNKIIKEKYPKLSIIKNDFKQKEINFLHKKYHCYVSASRGEGWNLPLMDACFYGNYIISTHPHGITEYISKSDIFFPIKSKKTNVSGMEWFKYMDNTHKWFDPSIRSIQAQMRNVYNRWKTKTENGNIMDYDYESRMSLKAILDERINYKGVAQEFRELFEKKLKNKASN